MMQGLLITGCRWCCAAALAAAIWAWHMGVARGAEAERVYLTTATPLGMILREVAGDRAEVRVLLAPGASPHTYEPKPSDLRAASAATAFFYCSPLLDGWAADIGRRDAIALFDLVPAELRLELTTPHHHQGADGSAHEREHAGGGPELDPHFWLSPRTVRGMLPALAAKLSALDPGGAPEYQANARVFDAALAALDQELAGSLAGVKGESLLLFHPSFNYLIHDYGLKLAGVVEPVPGQEPTPQFLAQLTGLVRAANLKALFTEPQLPKGPAEAIARETGLPLYELDPEGSAHATTYAGLLRYNARVLAEALGG
jgi:ABC-type Zn uptake system ZnuABC Zn-binding protein ZnuA